MWSLDAPDYGYGCATLSAAYVWLLPVSQSLADTTLMGV